MRIPLHLYHQFQGEGTRECGPTAAAIAANAYWGRYGVPPSLFREDVGAEMNVRSISARSPREILRVPFGPTFSWGIEAYIESLGRLSLPTEWRSRETLERVKENIEESRITIVIIGEIKPIGLWAHYVLPYGYDGDKFYFVDPSFASQTSLRIYSTSEFERLWRAWGAFIVEIGR